MFQLENGICGGEQEKFLAHRNFPFGCWWWWLVTNTHIHTYSKTWTNGYHQKMGLSGCLLATLRHHHHRICVTWLSRKPHLTQLYGKMYKKKTTKPHKYISKDDHDRKLHIIFPREGEREMGRKCKTAADDAKIQFIAAQVNVWALEGDGYSSDESRIPLYVYLYSPHTHTCALGMGLPHEAMT